MSKVIDNLECTSLPVSSLIGRWFFYLLIRQKYPLGTKVRLGVKQRFRELGITGSVEETEKKTGILMSTLKLLGD